MIFCTHLSLPQCLLGQIVEANIRTLTVSWAARGKSVLEVTLTKRNRVQLFKRIFPVAAILTFTWCAPQSVLVHLLPLQLQHINQTIFQFRGTWGSNVSPTSASVSLTWLSVDNNALQHKNNTLHHQTANKGLGFLFSCTFTYHPLPSWKKIYYSSFYY